MAARGVSGVNDVYEAFTTRSLPSDSSAFVTGVALLPIIESPWISFFSTIYNIMNKHVSRTSGSDSFPESRESCCSRINHTASVCVAVVSRDAREPVDVRLVHQAILLRRSALQAKGLGEALAPSVDGVELFG